MLRKSAALLLATLVALSVLAGCAGQEKIAPPAAPGVPDYLCLIVIDACRPEYFDLAPMPNLKALSDRGAAYSQAWVGHVINNTPPGHTTIATGRVPAHSGILGFDWKDPGTGTMVRPTDFRGVYAGELGRIQKDAGDRSIQAFVKARYPDSISAAVSSHKFYAAASMGGYSADYIVFSPVRAALPKPQAGGQAKQAQQAEKAVKQEKRTPGEEMKELIDSPAWYVRGHKPPAEVLRAIMPPERGKAQQLSDTWAADVAIKLIQVKKPRVMLINLPDTDSVGHNSGGPAAPAKMAEVMRNVDAQIGRLVKAYKDAGLYDRTLFVVTADHGMIPNATNIDGAAIRKALSDAKVPVPAAQVPHIWLRDPSQAKIAADAIATAGIRGVGAVYHKTSDGFRISDRSPKIAPELDAAYRYLIETYDFTRGPDVVAMLNENALPGEYPPNSRGAHGSITWGTQHIPMIFAGPGVRAGMVSQQPARLADIAPTVLRIMGIEPRGMDGAVLADCLIKEDPALIAQMNLRAKEASYIAALRFVSENQLKDLR